MTDYNVEVLFYDEDYYRGEEATGMLTLDGVRRYWTYYNHESQRSKGYPVYEVLPKETPIKTRQRLKDGRKLRRLQICKRSDYAAIASAIWNEVQRRAAQQFREREAAEREADNETTNATPLHQEETAHNGNQ